MSIDRSRGPNRAFLSRIAAGAGSLLLLGLPAAPSAMPLATPWTMLLASPSAMLLAVPSTLAPSAPGPAFPPQTSPERVFLGPDGQPLPFRSDEEVLRFLENAEVISLTRIPVGVTHPRQALLEMDGVRARAAYRDFDETFERVRLSDDSFAMSLRDAHINEAAAYRMARLLGLDNVPPAVARRHSGKMVTLQLWIENALVESERRAAGLQPPSPIRFRREVQTMYLFDDLIGNVDRNEGNLLFDRDTWKLWMIDHTRAFQRGTELRNLDNVNWCRADLWERVRTLERAAVDQALARLVGRYEIDAMFERRDKLVAHIQALIDERGESAVLFQSER